MPGRHGSTRSGTVCLANVRAPTGIICEKLPLDFAFLLEYTIAGRLTCCLLSRWPFMSPRHPMTLHDDTFIQAILENPQDDTNCWSTRWLRTRGDGRASLSPTAA